MDADDRHSLDALDAQRVLANVSEGLFGRELAQARVGRFVLLDKLGAGGMGVVYSAFDPELDRRVAIKVLHRERDPNDANERLLREARALAKLSHPNVVTVYEVGTVDQQVFLAMELVDGASLDHWLEEPRPWVDVVPVFMRAGRGLAAAHAQGLVHRDFKPSNVMVGDDGRVIVLDFGLARTEHVPVTLDSARRRAGVRRSGTLTETRAIVGTPLYMSPEQFEGTTVGSASDQFSFCVSLYEAVFGERPFAGETMAELSVAVRRGQLRSFDGASKVPAWLEAVIARGLSVEPEARFPSMEALLEALEGPARAWWRRPGSWVAVLGVGVGVGALVWGGAPSEGLAPCEGADAKVAEHWGDERREAMRAAFEATGLPYAEDARRGAAAALDDYGQRWAQAHHDACAATRIRGEQSEALMDRRMICLAERLEALDAMAELMTEADGLLVRKAVAASHRLPDLAPCADVAGLLEGEPTLTPEVQQQRSRLRRALVRATTQRHAGRYDAAREGVDVVFAEASEVDERLVRGEAGIERALLDEKGGKFEAAEAAAKQALWDGMQVDDARVQSIAASLLVSLVGRQLRRFEEGRDWGHMAQALLVRRGDPPRGCSLLAAARARLEFAAGDYTRAQLEQLEALELHRGEPEPDPLRLARLLAGLGLYEGALGSRGEALEHHRQAVAIRERMLGPAHPDTGKSYVDIGVQLMEMGRLPESIAAYDKGGAIWREAFGPDHIKMARFENNYANALAASGHESDALAHYREAIRVYVHNRGVDDVRVAPPYQNLGITLSMLGRPQEALSAFQEALRIYRSTVGEQHPGTIELHIVLADVLQALGEAERALDHARIAVEIGREAHGEQHELYAGARLEEGESLQALGRIGEAIVVVEEAVAIYSKIETRAEEKAGAYFFIAQLLGARDRPGDGVVAWTWATRARDVLAEDPLPHDSMQAKITRWLSEHEEAGGASGDAGEG